MYGGKQGKNGIVKDLWKKEDGDGIARGWSVQEELAMIIKGERDLKPAVDLGRVQRVQVSHELLQHVLRLRQHLRTHTPAISARGEPAGTPPRDALKRPMEGSEMPMKAKGQ